MESACLHTLFNKKSLAVQETRTFWGKLTDYRTERSSDLRKIAKILEYLFAGRTLEAFDSLVGYQRRERSITEEQFDETLALGIYPTRHDNDTPDEIFVKIAEWCDKTLVVDEV